MAGEELEVALGSQKPERKELSCGILPSGDVAYLDLKYVLGDNGAHINIMVNPGWQLKPPMPLFCCGC